MSETSVTESETAEPQIAQNPVIPVTSRRNYAHPKDLRERCKLLYFQGLKLDAITSETGVKQQTLRVWANRFKWNATVTAGRQLLVARGERMLTREAITQIEHTSGKLRAKLASVLQKGAEALDQVDVKPNVQAVRELSEALEPLVRSAKIVHSWGNEGPAGIVLADLLGQEQEPIEVPSCVQDATISSVPPAPAEPQSIQDAQPNGDQPQAQPLVEG